MPAKWHKDDCARWQTQFTGIFDLSRHVIVTEQNMFAFGENHNSAWNDEHFYLFISSSLCDINQIKRKLQFFLILTHHHTDSCVWNKVLNLLFLSVMMTLSVYWCIYFSLNISYNYPYLRICILVSLRLTPINLILLHTISRHSFFIEISH